jgi:ABC transporter substrate binding protein
MRRREFVSVVCGVAAWPLTVCAAQQCQRVRRLGVLMPGADGDMVGLRRAKIFAQALQDLGWTDGQNTQIDYRWAGGDIEQIQSLAKELVGSRPDVLVGIGPASTAALQQATRTIPIVFLMSFDPVAEGIVESNSVSAATKSPPAPICTQVVKASSKSPSLLACTMWTLNPSARAAARPRSPDLRRPDCLDWSERRTA